MAVPVREASTDGAFAPDRVTSPLGPAKYAAVGDPIARAAGRAEPFLRWVGGKRWLIPKLRFLIGGRSFSEYREPFLGGGSVFFGLAPTCPSTLSDTNADLVETFRAIRDSPEAVARQVQEHENEAAYYYRLRDSRPADEVGRAARFIFLNRTSFNGVHRVNQRGEYNVPFGYKANPKIPGTDELIRASEALAGVALLSMDFEASLDALPTGGLAYLDPPYTVAHDNNGFIKYNERLFTFADQERLAVALAALDERGCYYLLSNAHHESIHALFGGPGRRILEVERRNSVGGGGATRGSAKEHLITNLPA